MKIFIDGEIFETSPESIDSKAKMLGEVEAHLNASERVFTSISVDGVEIEPGGFARLRGGMEARFTTCKIQSLVIESLHEALTYLIRLSDSAGKLAGEFERNEAKKAQSSLADFAEGMGWLVSVMQKTQSLLGISDSELAGKTELVNKLNAALSEISECVVDGRLNEIAFHIRQKIIPSLPAIKIFLEQLLGNAGQR